MTDGYHIMPLTEAHVKRLAKLEAEIFADAWSENAFRNLLTHDYCHYLVAEADGKVAGFAGMTVIAGEGDVDKVMVAPEYRRRGLAEELLRELFALGEGLGVEAYTLEVRVSNAPAIRLYEKMGFCGEGVRPGFYEKPKEDALIMWKRLS